MLLTGEFSRPSHAAKVNVGHYIISYITILFAGVERSIKNYFEKYNLDFKNASFLLQHCGIIIKILLKCSFILCSPWSINSYTSVLQLYNIYMYKCINVLKSSRIVVVAMLLNLILFFFKFRQRVTFVLVNPFKAYPDAAVKMF